MDKVKIGATSLSDDDLVDLIIAHGTAMTGNANFTTPLPNAADYTAGTGSYVTAHNAVKALETQLAGAIITRDNARPAAVNMLNQRGAYVQTASGGVAAKILTSAFGVQDKPGPGGQLLKPANVAASMGDLTGETDVQWDRQKGRSFIVQCTETPTIEASWVQCGVTTRSRYTAKGLVSGKKYFFRICAVLGGESGPWSDEASSMAG